MDQKTEAIERALGELEGELATHFALYERIAVQRVLERLADDVPQRQREQWDNL